MFLHSQHEDLIFNLKALENSRNVFRLYKAELQVHNYLRIRELLNPFMSFLSRKSKCNVIFWFSSFLSFLGTVFFTLCAGEPRVRLAFHAFSRKTSRLRMPRCRTWAFRDFLTKYLTPSGSEDKQTTWRDKVTHRTRGCSTINPT